MENTTILQNETNRCKKALGSKGWMVVNLIKTNKNGIPDYMMLKDNCCIFVEKRILG